MTKNRTTKTPRVQSAHRLPYIAHGASALVWIIQAAILAWAVQHFVITQQAGIPLNWTRLCHCAIGIIGLGFIRSTTEAWAARRIYLQARTYLTQLRADTLHTLSQQSPLDKHRPASGVVASMLAEQAEAIVPWMSRYQSAQWRVMTVPFVIAAVVAWQSWVAAVILLVSAPLIPLFMAIVGWRAQAVSEKQMVEMGEMNGFLLDRLRGLSTLRAMHAIEATTAHVRASGESLKERTMAVLKIAFLSSAVLELFSALGVAMVAVYVGFHFLGSLPFGAWGHSLSMGQGLFILLLAPAFYEPLRELSAAWHDRANGIAAMNNIATLSLPAAFIVGDKVQAAQTTQTTETPLTTAATAVAIDINDLTFAHSNAPPVFEQLTLSIAAGERLALTGASGSGKSILLALIAGLLAPNQGRILLNGVPMEAAHARALRHQIAWMGQKPHIFTGSIHTNVFLGSDTTDMTSMTDSLRATGMDQVINQLPVHVLGEGGLGLSGGEVARLALVRLAAQSQAGLIILDEPTAHLDYDTAQQVIAAINAIARNKTLIIATHDPGLLAQMDRCITITAPVMTIKKAMEVETV